nr:MAG TPA: hypothetical protein [Caudoviricetes sp.]
MFVFLLLILFGYLHSLFCGDNFFFYIRENKYINRLKERITFVDD